MIKCEAAIEKVSVTNSKGSSKIIETYAATTTLLPMTLEQAFISFFNIFSFK